MIENTPNIQYVCPAGDEAYSEICSKLAKLCPRLVPSPLWGLSLARVSRMAPQASLTICDSCPEIVESMYHY